MSYEWLCTPTRQCMKAACTLACDSRSITRKDHWTSKSKRREWPCNRMIWGEDTSSSRSYMKRLWVSKSFVLLYTDLICCFIVDFYSAYAMETSCLFYRFIVCLIGSQTRGNPELGHSQVSGGGGKPETNDRKAIGEFCFCSLFLANTSDKQMPVTFRIYNTIKWSF